MITPLTDRITAVISAALFATLAILSISVMSAGFIPVA